MTAVVYASLAAFLVVWLSLNVIKIRHAKQISLGDGGDPDLTKAIAAQTNAIEYLPMAILLLLVLEYNGAPLIVVHALGLLLLVGRLVHAKAILTNNLKTRVLGMQITIWILIVLASANLLFVPYGKLLTPG